MDEDRERIKALYRWYQFHCNEGPRPAEKVPEKIIRRRGFMEKPVLLLSKEEKMQLDLQQSSYLQNLYWQNHYSFLNLMKELELKEEQSNIFIERCIPPVPTQDNCFVCGQEIYLTFTTIEEYEKCTDFFDHMEPVCHVNNKTFKLLCNRCKEWQLLNKYMQVRENENEDDRTEIVKWLEHFKGREYREYLLTYHWARIKKLKKEASGADAFYCSECEERFLSYMLHLHHKTYAHKGREDEYLEDLTYLCQKCHSNTHRREGKTTSPLIKRRKK